MKTLRLLARCLLISGVAAALGSVAAAETHKLTPTPKTVTWGYFDAKTPPVLRVKSGDIVDVEALIAAAPRQLGRPACRATRSSRRSSTSIAR